MPGGATGRFTDPESYVANLRVMAMELVVTGSGRFDGRLTWAQFSHVDVLCAQEAGPRIGYISPPSSLCVTFPTRPGPALLVNGMALQHGEFAFHPRGECFHQRTTGAARWGLLAITPRFASLHAAALIAPARQVFRPPTVAATRFLRLHARLCHIVETCATRIGQPNVARALEQELIQALTTCFCCNEMRTEPDRTQRHVDILARFEHELTAHPDRVLPMPALCAIVGTSERTLTACCTEVLGMSAGRYIRLRRLNRVRRAILDADPIMAKVSEIARSHSFTELGRFAVLYREAFGETPSTTLRRVRDGATFEERT